MSSLKKTATQAEADRIARAVDAAVERSGFKQRGLGRVGDPVEAGRAMQFLLHGFPCKCADRHRTIGPDPDMAERVAVAALAGLARDLRRACSPRAEVVIATHGMVTADLEGVPDAEVAAYQRQLETMVAATGERGLLVFGLQEWCAGDPPAARKQLARQWPHLDSTNSATRTIAWKLAVKSRFPHAVELQWDGSNGAVPWEGVAVDRGIGRFEIVARDRAETLGCSLVWAGGRPSHYVYAG